MMLAEVRDTLSRAQVSDPGRHAEWMLQEALGVERSSLYAYPERRVPEAAREQLRAWVRRRRAGEPLQYILGKASFRNLSLRVTPQVLIPRPETEEVVEEALRRIKNVENPSVLDVGTGSGCIALSIKQECTEAEVTAAENSRAALELARHNAEELGLAVRFVEADMLAEDFAGRLPAPFDLVVCNPPYVLERERRELPAEVYKHEPHEALFAGEDPLRFYRALARHLGVLLRTGAVVVVEIHEEMGGRVAALFRRHGLEEVEVRADLAGKDRIAVGRLPAAD